MAKKVVATLKTGKEGVIANDQVKAFFEEKK